MQGADGQLNGHLLLESAYLGFVYFPAENHVIQVGDRSDGCSVVEGIGLDDRVSDLHRNVENHPRDGGTNLRITHFGISAGDTVLDDLQIVFCVLHLFFGSRKGGLALLEFLFRDNSGVKELFDPIIVASCLLKADLGYVDA